MQLKQLYFIAFQDYPHEVCLGLCAAHAIHMSMRISEKDLAEPGRFDARLEKKNPGSIMARTAYRLDRQAVSCDGYTASLPTDRNETPEFVVPYRDTLVATQIDVINFCLTEG